ncbi:MAG: sigma-70 family RNA polymerase sigma factor [Phycisphaerales bacterium]
MHSDEHAEPMPHDSGMPRADRDAAWITRELRNGSNDALAEAYDRFAEAIVRDVSRRTGRDEAFALDCLQETMVRLAGSPPACSSDGEFGAWLRVVAIRAVRTALVAESRRVRRECAHAAERRSASIEGSAGERRAEEDDADLDRVLSQLDEDERELLRLRVVHGWSISAIARWIAMEPRRVEGRVRRMLARLRERGRA